MRTSDLKPGQRFKLATDPRTLTALYCDPAFYRDTVYAVDDSDNLIGTHPDSYCELIAETPGKALPFSIVHHADDRLTLRGRVEVKPQGIEIYFDGYGVHGAAAGFGSPVFIEVDDNGHPVLRAWAEIDSEDPTHKINLAAARDTRPPE